MATARRKTNTIGAISIMSIFLFAALLSGQPRETSKGIKIACNLPLTGELESYGRAVQEGALMALEDLKEQGSVPLEFVWDDNRSSGREAVLIASRQLMNKPNLYVSGLKPQYMAIHDMVKNSGIPNFVWIFDAHLRTKGERNFRTYVNYKIEPPLFIDYASEKKAKRAAILYVQIPNTDEEYNSTIIPGLKARGVNDLLIEPFDMNKMDFRDIAVRVAQFKPDLLILSAFQANFVGLIRSLRQLGLIKEGNTLATYDLIDAIPLLAGNDLEGIHVSAPSFLLEPYSEKFTEWRSRFVERYHKNPIYTHAFGYDMVLALSYAARNVSAKKHNARGLTEAIQNVSGEGITGPLSFDEDGDLKIKVELGALRGGKLMRENYSAEIGRSS